MNGLRDPEIDVVREAAEDVPEVSERARAHGHARLMAAVGGMPGRRVSRGRIVVRVAVPTVTAAAVAGAAFLVADRDAPLPGRAPTVSGSPQVRLVSAETVLAGAARYERGRPRPPIPRGDQYIYTRGVLKEVELDGGRTRVFRDESWRSVDGRHASWVEERGKSWSSPPDEFSRYDWPPVSYEVMAELPTETEELLDELYRWPRGGAEGRPSWSKMEPEAVDRLYSMVVGLVVAPAVKPRGLRAAAFEALREIPGVRIRQRSVDMWGRTGIGVSRTDSRGQGGDDLLVFDAKTYAFLGGKSFAENEHGRVVRYSGVERWGIADRMREIPKVTYTD